jgi:predicted phage gp36 major capsid-like protein
VKGANQRPTGQAGWFAFWRVGADASTTNAFRVLTIA